MAIQTAVAVTASRSGQDWLARREAAVAQGVAYTHPVFIDHAVGAEMFDTDGRRYIDFVAGIGTLNVGSSHPAVLAAIHAQVDRFLHTCTHTVLYPEYVRVAERLAAITPGTSPKKAVLLNSGSEAVDNAVKIARRYTGRQALITFENAFHGRTMMALSLTDKVDPYKKGLGPFMPEVYRVPAPYTYRSPFATEAACVEASLDALRRAIYVEAGAQNVAGIILEPIQGEGGFIPMPAAFLQGVRALATECGALFIDDEIQSGMGRTGRMFAVEDAGVVPDLVLIAKSVAAGMPLSAVVGPAEVMDAVHTGALGGTYGGNPVSCAAALAAMDVIERERLWERAERIGEQIMARGRTWLARYPSVGDVRGLGAMVGVELVRDRRTKAPAAEIAAALVEEARERGLLLIKAGIYNNVVRFLPPLVISDDLLNEGLDIFERALEAAQARA
jgi:4-aminobutyrate aminotransferase/(S)-3-amino-2-methylpropionate transaminase